MKGKTEKENAKKKMKGGFQVKTRGIRRGSFSEPGPCSKRKSLLMEAVHSTEEMKKRH